MSAAYLVKTARRRAGLTQRALAARSGIPQPHIARVEAGRTDPRASTLFRLLHFCDHSLEALPGSGRGVDRTLSAELLRLTPARRLQSAESDASALDGFGPSRP